MILLGIDFGLRKIGLALSEAGLPYPLLTINNSPSSIKEIVKICKENKVEKIIVGLPEGKLVPKIKRFAENLSRLSKLPVEFQDETLTTFSAIAKMIETGRKKKIRKKIENAVAASCILQEYLEGRRGV